MPVGFGCALYFVQDSAAIELLAEGSSVLVLLAAAVLFFRAFREKYLFTWILAWIAYIAYRYTSTGALGPSTAGRGVLSNAAFIVAVTLFAASVLYYSNARRQLLATAALAAIALAIMGVRAAWFPNSRPLAVSLHAVYMLITVSAAIRLVLFSRGRRELGPWLTAVMLVLVHLDEAPHLPHDLTGLDLVIELLLGLGMLMIVLEDSRERARRLGVVNAITMAIARAQDPSAVMKQALAELKKLLHARAAWYRVLQNDKLIILEHIGLSERFIAACSELASEASVAATRTVRRGVPVVFRLSDLDQVTRGHFIDEGLDHLLLVPIRGKNSIIGTLAFAAERLRSYTQDELNFLLATGNQLGIALENLELIEQILRSQRQWISTFDSIDDVILVHDSEFRIIKVNRALLRRLGRPLQQIVFKSCEATLPHTQQWSGCPYCTDSQSLLTEAPDPCFGGYSLVSTSSYVEEGSERQGTIHIVKDTTERRAAEERYRMLFEQAQEGVFISTPEGHVVDCNDAFVRMLGYNSREEVLTLDLRHCYAHPEQRDAFRQEIAAHNYVRDYEVMVRRKDGGLLTVLENSFASRDASGRIERYQGFLLDITEKKRAEDGIRRRNRELHALNDIAVIATQSFDLDEILNVTLRQLMDLFAADTGSAYLFDEDTLTLRYRTGYGHRSDLGTRMPEIKIPQELWQNLKATHTEVITSEHMPPLPAHITEFVQAEDLHSWMWTIMWSKDKAVGILGISSHRPREFTSTDEDLMIAAGRQLATTLDKVHLYEETCRAYDDLRRTQEQLLQSEKMSAVGQMISGVAHELNNPLTAILGYAQLLESEDLGERCRDYVQKVLKQAQRTQRVVQNLLSFSRQRKPEKGQVDLRRVLEDTLALRDYDLKLNNIAVERDLQGNLPTVTADAHQMEQVFLNILNNAVDAILENARSGVLKVRIYADGTYVCTEFQDSGPGMKEPSRVFDPFYTTKGVGKGTGLGLSICYGIVKEHRGDILALNPPDGGALFRVVLPASGAMARPEVEASPKRRGLVLQGRILLIDDEEAVLEFEREVLTGAGADVIALSRGEEAIARLQRDWFDAAVIDCKMPGKWTGMEIYRWITENRPALRHSILFTVSNVADTKTRAFLEETGLACIVKPFEVADLIAMARRILARRSATSAN